MRTQRRLRIELVAGSAMRSSVDLTAAALNGAPSWKLTSWRSSKVYSVVSWLMVQLVASPG